MAKHVVFFTFKSETVAGMIAHPSDRAAVVRKLAETVGGKLEAYYWMTGPHDGFVIVDGSDPASVAAISLAVASTGAFTHLETYELFSGDAISGVLAKAKELQSAYTPPGR